jgi:NAD-dependent DNA ligase
MNTSSTGRQLVEELLLSMGATIQNQVTGKTDLVIALQNPSKSKIAKAEKLGLPIVYIGDYFADN